VGAAEAALSLWHSKHVGSAPPLAKQNNTQLFERGNSATYLRFCDAIERDAQRFYRARNLPATLHLENQTTDIGTSAIGALYLPKFVRRDRIEVSEVPHSVA
jgi:hypothetical protein